MTSGPSQQTGYEHVAAQLSRLCGAVGLADPSAALSLFRDMLGAWGHAALGAAPAWPSDITDDATPVELSVAFTDGAPELRFLVEACGSDPSLPSRWEAGRALSLLLERRHGIDLGRLRRIEPLFAPAGSSGVFAMWHAARLHLDRPIDFKLYLSPQARGRSQARALVEEALRALGLPGAWRAFSEHALRRRPELDELAFFSIDLTPRQAARVKVYTTHHEATFDELAAVLRAVPDDPAEVQRFHQVITADRPYIGRPPVTSLAFVEGRSEPVEATVHLPIRAYVAHDEEARGRIRAALAPRAGELAAYDRVMAAFAARRLDAGVGMHTYISRCRHRGGARHTLYLSPEAYRVMPPRASSASGTSST